MSSDYPDPAPMGFVGTRPPDDPHYLGDGLTARFDGFHIWLISNTNQRVALEPAVLTAFLDFAKRYWRISP